ncbi:diphosphomevalonate decarboxylase [Paucilactobacillus hokkaidonensis JCM 18461]|uniref:diphosphomevalonate decarboxylase n=2 Tax=Paucilactobacillus hokkaidonensis TaxID=1193095 RepID=A0A0A1GTK4_9LACO|nr:diphosphomevalonate decarboxylase [Paucilactobacillus hokkaidonensis JCM 18461]
MTQMYAKARAHTNIALVKYWGKKNQELILPYTDSLSLTLNEFYTTTEVTFNAELIQDSFLIDGQSVDSKNEQKLTHFMNLVRQQSNCSLYATVNSENHVPISAGLASSSSAFAALAAAASKAAGLNLDQTQLSRLARRGSGSATRSVFGGLVEWRKGNDDETSFAVPVDEQVDFGLEMIAILTDTRVKKVSSRSGMQNVVATSPYYPAWQQVVANDMVAMKSAIVKKDINLIGQIAEENAMRMHALTLSAQPSFTYFNADSLVAMSAIKDLRTQGINCYYTLDAGPNVKVIYQHTDRKAILDALSTKFSKQNLVVSLPGPGIEYLE